MFLLGYINGFIGANASISVELSTLIIESVVSSTFEDISIAFLMNSILFCLLLIFSSMGKNEMGKVIETKRIAFDQQKPTRIAELMRTFCYYC